MIEVDLAKAANWPMIAGMFVSTIAFLSLEDRTTVMGGVPFALVIGLMLASVAITVAHAVMWLAGFKSVSLSTNGVRVERRTKAA